MIWPQWLSKWQWETTVLYLRFWHVAWTIELAVRCVSFTLKRGWQVIQYPSSSPLVEVISWFKGCGLQIWLMGIHMYRGRVLLQWGRLWDRGSHLANTQAPGPFWPANRQREDQNVSPKQINYGKWQLSICLKNVPKLKTNICYLLLTVSHRRTVIFLLNKKLKHFCHNLVISIWDQTRCTFLPTECGLVWYY